MNTITTKAARIAPFKEQLGVYKCGALVCVVCLLLLSLPLSAGSIFDGYLPCAANKECTNQPGDRHGAQPGPIDFQGVRNYGQAVQNQPTESKLRPQQNSVNTNKTSNSRSLNTDTGTFEVTTIQCDANTQPIFLHLCSKPTCDNGNQVLGCKTQD